MKHLNGTYEPDPPMRPGPARFAVAVVVAGALLGFCGFAAFAAPEILVEAYSARPDPCTAPSALKPWLICGDRP